MLELATSILPFDLGYPCTNAAQIRSLLGVNPVHAMLPEFHSIKFKAQARFDTSKKKLESRLMRREQSGKSAWKQSVRSAGPEAASHE